MYFEVNNEIWMLTFWLSSMRGYWPFAKSSKGHA